MIEFPRAPWKLGGWGVGTVSLVDASAVAPTLPAGAGVVSIAKGKTLGGIVFLTYQSGALAYRELGVATALVRVGSRVGFWVSRLYVDHAAGLHDDHAVWGASRELATFEFAHNIGVTVVEVRAAGRDVCRLRCSVPTRGLRVPLRLPAFGVHDDQILHYNGRLDASVSLVKATVEVPEDGEFAPIRLDRPRFALRFEDLSLTVPQPSSALRVAHPAEREHAYGTS